MAIQRGQNRAAFSNTTETAAGDYDRDRDRDRSQPGRATMGWVHMLHHYPPVYL